MKKLRKTIHQNIAEDIPPGSKVLDLGCGDGVLLNYLKTNKNVKCVGVDIDSKAIIKCLEKGIPVIQLDLDELPLDFADKSFDIVILNQTIQQVIHPDMIILEMLRIGKEAILGFPNYGNFNIRTKFFFLGKMPVTKELPYEWYDTPNIHLLSINDFISFCRSNKIKIKKKIFLKRKKIILSKRSQNYKKIKFFPNLRADLAIFKMHK